MTRLTDEDVRGISDSLDDLNGMLMRCSGMTTMEMAFDAAAVAPGSLDLEEFRAGVIPVTSGMGVITRFSESVADICVSLGMDAFVTDGHDVSGLAEALSKDVDIFFMADDNEFIACNMRSGRYSNNSFSTAAGYVSALNGAAGGLIGRTVLVLGAGRVGSRAVSLLSARGASVVLADTDVRKARAVAAANPGTAVEEDIRKAIASNSLVINASPAHVRSEDIAAGAIIASPGIPHTFDEEAYAKAVIIHDPLGIGVSVMAVQSASFSRPGNRICRR